MRGALKEKSTGGQRTRIIPADAGSTDRFGHQYNVNKDHPRGCGEHCNTIFKHIFYLGSSPRMRGAPYASDLADRADRIIPADAGSTDDETGIEEIRPDHPRGCGEHSFTVSFRRIWAGSSPRMRGAPYDGIPRKLQRRIIPADAGSTGRRLCLLTRIWDHPRGCGEHFSKSSRSSDMSGSSPRMRGAPKYFTVSD